MFSDPQSLLGSAIDSYTLIRVLGEGGAGVVFLGQMADGSQTAVKVLLPAGRTTPVEMAGLRQRFLREAKVLAQLQHPHILPVLGYGEDPRLQHFYLLMPYLPGGTLADRLSAGPLSFEETKRYIGELASALDYAHARGVIHRDVKPSNVLLDAAGQAVLADFGIAKVVDTLDTTLTATGEVLGTPAYMALEQIRGDKGSISAQTDIYALGAVAYHALTGQKPYGGTTPHAVLLAIAQTDPTPARQLRPDLPEPAEATLCKAMAREPSQRFASAGSFAAALTLALDGEWPAGVPELEGAAVTQPALPPPAGALALQGEVPAMQTRTQQDTAFGLSTYQSVPPPNIFPASEHAVYGAPWPAPASTAGVGTRPEAARRSGRGRASGVALLLLVAALIAAAVLGAGYATLHGINLAGSQATATQGGSNSSNSAGGGAGGAPTVTSTTAQNAPAATSTAAPNAPTATSSTAATAVPPNSYVAHLPGPCDSGAAQWRDDTSGGKVTYTCQPDGLHISSDNGIAPEYTLIGGLGPRPSTFTLSIHATGFSGTACVGFVFGDNDEGGLCNNGYWTVFDFSSGNVAPSSSFTLAATCKPGEVDLYENGSLLVRQPLPGSTCTYQISFYAEPDLTQSTAKPFACVLSDFVFTPLS
jgi:serine/threonine protein kinase